MEQKQQLNQWDDSGIIEVRNGLVGPYLQMGLDTPDTCVCVCAYVYTEMKAYMIVIIDLRVETLFLCVCVCIGIYIYMYISRLERPYLIGGFNAHEDVLDDTKERKFDFPSQVGWEKIVHHPKPLHSIVFRCIMKNFTTSP